MKKGLVSVVIPNYNYEHFLRETIDSVLAQTYTHIEIIVVDDGSTDGSREILESYGTRIRTIFQQNQGVSTARNNGVAASSGEFIAFLDADDSWLPTKIEKQVRRFSDESGLGLVHVGVHEVDSEGRSILERLEGIEGQVAGELLMLKREGVLGGGSGLLVPRGVFDQVGGFDTRLSTSADWDLFFQIASRYPVRFIPELLIRYRVHQSNMHANVAVMERDMTIAFEKAFGDATPEIAKLKRRAYGILNRTLAASYLRSRKYSNFLRTAFRSIAYYPPILLGGDFVFLSAAFIYLYLTLFLLPATPIFFENDHFIQMYDSARMMGGEIIYRDFFQFTFPGTEVWYLALFTVFGQRISLVNATIVCLGFSLTWSILAISKRLMSGVFVYVAPALFLFFGFRWYGMDGGHRLFSCLFATLAILAVFDKISRKRLIVAGAFCALAASFTQTRGVAIVAVLTVFLVWRSFPFRQFKPLVSSLLLLGASFGVSLLVLTGYFLLTAGVGPFLESTIFFAQSYNADPVNNSNLYLQFWRDLFRGSVNISSLPVDLFYYVMVPGVYVVPPVYYFIKKPVDRELWQKVMLLCIGGIFLFMVTTGLNPVRLYHVSIPGLALISLWLSRLSIYKIPLAGVAASVFASVVLCIWGQIKPYPANALLPTGTVAFTSDTAAEKYRWVNDHTDPGDLVFESYRTVINFPLMVKNPASVPMLRDTNYTSRAQVESVIGELTARPPKYILWNGAWNKPQTDRAPDDHLGPMFDFLIDRYELREKLIPVYGIDIQVWEKKGTREQ